jgi:hypothetical protein
LKVEDTKHALTKFLVKQIQKCLAFLNIKTDL